MVGSSEGARHARVVGVDPVPGEVAKSDRRDAGRSTHCEGERRDVSDDQPGTQLTQRPRFAGGARHQIAVEGGRAPDAVRFIERQRVRLDDAGITLQRAVLTFPLTVRSNSQRGADVRTPTRVSGRWARMALMTSMEREA